MNEEKYRWCSSSNHYFIAIVRRPDPLLPIIMLLSGLFHHLFNGRAGERYTMQTTDPRRADAAADAAAAASVAVNNLVQLGAGGSSNHFNITNNNHTTFNSAHTHNHHHYRNIAPAQSPTRKNKSGGNYKNGGGNDAADSGDTNPPQNKPPPQKQNKVMPCTILFSVQLYHTFFPSVSQFHASRQDAAAASVGWSAVAKDNDEEQQVRVVCIFIYDLVVLISCVVVCGVHMLIL